MRGHRRLSVCWTAGFGAALMLSGATATYAAGPHPTAQLVCDRDGSSSDFDGDRVTDTVVGMPSYNAGSGAVDIRGSASASWVLTAEMLGGQPSNKDGLGTAVALGDLDHDGCADLVVSAPHRSGGPGQVHIMFGGPGGLTTANAITLTAPSTDLAEFGAALALNGDLYNSGPYELYVGAPATTVSGKPNAGVVVHYSLTAAPATRVVATLRDTRHQDSPGVPGGSEEGDGFGSVLASSYHGVLVGTPGEDVGAKRDAGAVWFLGVGDDGVPTIAQSWTQDSPGVAGAAETGDHFGASLDARGSDVIIGVPDEDSGSKIDSGAAQILYWDYEKALFQPLRAITQDSPGVPGKSEAHDRFGAAVAVGVALQCQEFLDAAIGAPGEDVGRVADAGTITLVTVHDEGSCRPTVVRQGAGLAGAAETGDRVGSVLGTVVGDLSLEEDYSDRLLIGVPLEDVGTTRDAGIVQPLRGYLRSNGTDHRSLSFSAGVTRDTGYGQVLGAAAY